MAVAVIERHRVDGEDLLAVAEFGDDEQLAVAQFSGDVRRPLVAVGRSCESRRRRSKVEDESRLLAGAHEEGYVHRVG